MAENSSDNKGHITPYPSMAHGLNDLISATSLQGLALHMPKPCSQQLQKLERALEKNFQSQAAGGQAETCSDLTLPPQPQTLPPPDVTVVMMRSRKTCSPIP